MTIGKRDLKICVGASAGGHMNQLLRLLEYVNCWPCEPSVYVTTLPELAERLGRSGRTYVIGECNRNHLLQGLVVLIRASAIVLKERPDVIVTTGSLPIALMCAVAKLLGKKVVWIDSIANVERLSMSGSFVRHFADLFITQWPGLAEKYEGVEFVGAIV